jgi:Flp pilus assembly protein TadG
MREYRTSIRAVLAFLRDRRGAAMVEFAFMAPVLIVSLMGIIEYGRAFWIRNSLQHAADETGHYAMIHTAATPNELVSYAKQAAAPLDAGGITVTITNDTIGSVSFVTILTSYQAGIVIPFMPQTSITMVGRARVPQIS